MCKYLYPYLTLPHPVVVGEGCLEDPEAAVAVAAPARPLVLALLHPHRQPRVRDELSALLKLKIVNKTMRKS